MRPPLPAGLLDAPFSEADAEAFRAAADTPEAMAAFVDFTFARLLTRDHRSVFWGDRLLSLDKSAGFLEEPSFRAAYAAIRGAHQYDQYDSPFTIAWRLHTLVWAARAGLALPQGDFVECGTFQGDMAWMIHQTTDFARSGRRFFLFDSFDGFDPRNTSDADFPDLTGYVAFANQYYQRPDLYESVVRRFAPHPEVVVTKGFLPEALEGVAPARIAFLHIDLNAAAPEIACLDALFDRVVPGGAVVFDDYGWLVFRRQKDAEDAWMAARGYAILELPTGQGLVIKR